MAIFELLSTSTPILITVCIMLGILVGSFLNVVVYRMPIMLQRDWKQQCCEYLEIVNSVPDNNESSAKFDVFNLRKPDSHCPKCNHKIRTWENVPILSYLFLGGKCSNCKTRISLRYPCVELINGFISGLVAYTFGATLLTLAVLLLAWCLLALTLIDFDHQLLPDDITLPLLWLGLLVNAVDLGFGVSLRDAVIGTIAGYLVLWGFYWIFKLATGKEGMGYGDFKLLAALGAWMGWQSLLPIIILSSLVGAMLGLIMIVATGRNKSVPMPFGPFLAGAGFIMLIWGSQLNSFYLNTVIG
ncbi:MAG: A24 family peptidase [Gammaproteobacteria bacterium]|jgi:leader peptidase (prepilin peptidase)/N-methyltransferase|nr:A24 family peptidase [Gammaproteobacteria bacterium]MDP6652961.1 A24 family peptidase [Gammaproteobacteria bacterium]